MLFVLYFLFIWSRKDDYFFLLNLLTKKISRVSLVKLSVKLEYNTQLKEPIKKEISIKLYARDQAIKYLPNKKNRNKTFKKKNYHNNWAPYTQRIILIARIQAP